MRNFPELISDPAKNSDDSLQRRAIRQIAALERAGRPVSFRLALGACPFRTVISRSRTGQDLPRGELAVALLRNVGSVVALIESTASPIAQATMAAVQQDLAAGLTVLVMASNSAVRDHAKAEILNWASAPRGSA